MWFNVVVGWLHELGHVISGLLGGGVYEGVFVGVGTFYVMWSSLPTGIMGWLMPFGGGLLAVVTCFLMIWASNYEPDVRIAFYAIGMSQLAYGFAEGALWHLNLYDYIQPVGLVAMIAGNIYAVFTAKKMWNLEEIE